LTFPFGILALAAGALVRFRPDFILGVAHCPLRDLTGLPCPTCGGTHAAVALAQGRVGAALTANPLVTVGLVAFGIWIFTGWLATAVPGLRRDLVLTAREKKTARILAVVLLAAGWAWEIGRVWG
jgi:hypothetical protein